MSNQVDPDEISSLLKGEETQPQQANKKVVQLDGEAAKDIKEALNQMPEIKEDKPPRE